ncbi:hypothetical protein [Clostridium thermopalmarium]|uniref:Uncharacterized protein n=1 Tax=Clostridium thermopalmarium DSM 5974 TaxID=1121340 RepID=A0A2T0AZJ2_9CLOT|nr:hypothetical protein [Clostridium thermopalmarium]PRR76610.1 hypothetical protein CPAL_02810 [Clostridium thermopalmarium DSM 5974]PVZ28277.1 hypothetical protein LX19_00248 [Clostridium thermopalmarium DSM 5974]
MSQIENSMIATLGTDFADISKELMEVGIDSLLEDGILKNIPIIGALSSIYKAGISIRDRYFVRKILKFLCSLEDTSLDERKKFLSKHSDISQLGEKLIFILDRLDDLEKPKLIANLFKKYMYNEIDYITFQRLALIIEKCFIEDLKFLKNNRDKNMITGLEALGLANSGLASLASFDGGSFNEVDYNPETDYKINDLGKAVIRYAF